MIDNNTAPDNNSQGEQPDAGSLTVDERFAIVPEWLLDADISDVAVRLYAVLLRYGQSSGARMPGRTTLARRLRKKSVDTIDRAMRELVTVGAVSVEHRFAGAQRLTNRYHLHARQERQTGLAVTPASENEEGNRKNAATPNRNGEDDRTNAAGASRKNAATLAADMRHNPKHFTHSITTSSPEPMQATVESNRWRVEEERFLQSLSITDADAFVHEVAVLRRDAGGPSARWARPSLVAALQSAVKARGWPAELAAGALRIVAADPATRSPMRLAEAGPWWDQAAPASTDSQHEQTTENPADEGIPLAQVETELADTDGLRVHLQATARAELRAEGLPVTRATVLRRAHALLHQRQREASAC